MGARRNLDKEKTRSRGRAKALPSRPAGAVRLIRTQAQDSTSKPSVDLRLDEADRSRSSEGKDPMSKEKNVHR